MSFRYRALGLDLTADFPCPGLWPAETATTGRAVRLALGAVPEALADPLCDRPLLQVGRDGRALHHVPGVARYLIDDRHAVTIDLAPDATPERALDFLRGTPLALLCHRWGLVPFEAVAVAIDGRAVLLGGGPGCGKSTLALALRRHGGRLLADGLCALDARDPAAPVIWPAFPQMRLWPDSLAALDVPEPQGPRTPGGRANLACEDWFDPEPRPVGALALLQTTRGGLATEATRRRGLGAFTAVMNLRALADVARQVFDDQARLDLMARLASRLAVIEFWTPPEVSQAAEAPPRLLEALSALGGLERS